MTLPTETAPDQPDDRCPTCRGEIIGSWLVCAHCGTRLATTAALPDGALLSDRFRVLGVLGRGGFGITYEVTDERLQRRVAVKELFPDSAMRHGSVVLTPPHARSGFDEARERFLREARTLARFSHPGIVRVFEAFEQHNTAYLVLELVNGPSLADVLRARGRPLDEDEVVDIARRVAGALIAVHRAGMLHRDLSPSNLVRTPSGRIVLIDFGLAKAFSEDPAASMTRIVTPGYAPMEQYEGKGPFGPPTDVYGLAATLYRLVTGRTPVAATERSTGTPLPSPHRVCPTVSRSTSDAIMDGLELQYGHRPVTVAAFLARLGLDAPEQTAVVVLSPVAGPERRDTDLAPGAVVPRRPDGRPDLPAGSAGNGGASPAAAMPGLAAGGQAPPGDEANGVGRAPVASASTAGATAAWSGAGSPAVAGSGACSPHAASSGAGPRGSAWPATASPAATVAARPLAAAGDRAPGGSARPPTPAPWTAPHPSGESARRSASVATGRRPGRWRVTVPLAAASVSLCSAAPVLCGVVLVLVAVPAVATFGDLSTRRDRPASGGDGWLDRRTDLATTPLLAARNVGASAGLSVLALLFLVGMVAIWYLLDELAPVIVDELWLRATGALTAAIVLSMAARPGRLRTSVGLDELCDRLTTPTGGLSQPGWVLWIVGIALTAAGLFLTPEVWPLP